MNSKIKEVYLCSGDWATFHRQEFCREIHRKTNELLLVQFPVSLLLNLLLKFREKLMPYLRGGYKTIKTHEGIEVFSPFILTHPKMWLKFHPFAHIDCILLSYQLNKFLKKYSGLYKIRLWVYRPYHIFLIDRVKHDYLIFDAYDDNELDFDGKEIKTEIKNNRKLVKRSDLTLVVSKFTFDKYKVYSEKVFRIRNGFSPSIFKDGNYTVPEEFRYLSKPIIGYTGGIRNWLDIGLIKKILHSDKYILVLIGEINRNFKKEYEEISNHKNLLYLGFMSIEKLPNYIYFFRAGLLPYKINDFARSVFPLKFFEYAALGLPVVSTALPEMEQFKDYIGFSFSDDEFIMNCDMAVKGGFDFKINSLNQILSMNTWESVIDEIFNQFENLK